MDAQIEKLKQAGCQKIFSEKISGVADKRSELEAMLAILREDDTVIVTELSRIGRSLTHIVKTVEYFKKQNVHFKTLDLSVDTTTPIGSAILHFCAALSQLERELILERSRAGIEEAKRNGKHMGRPKGYDKEKLEKISMLKDKGLSSKEIAQLVGCHFITVKRYRKIIKDAAILTNKSKIVQQNIFGKVDLI